MCTCMHVDSHTRTCVYILHTDGGRLINFFQPRDMFVSRLLKKLTVTVETIVDPDDPIEVESTWEALADEEEEEEEEKREEEGERREVSRV